MAEATLQLVSVKAVAAGKPEPIIDDVENDDETVDEVVNQ
jgi:hypothetical protein